MTALLERGLVQIYTGENKGKTTAALGQAWRILGWGGAVYICQFLKPDSIATGEAQLAEHLAAALDDVKESGRLVFERLGESWDMRSAADNVTQQHRMSQAIAAKLQTITDLASSGEFDLMILDELILCLSMGLVTHDMIFQLIDNKAHRMELVLTGRGADARIIERADLVSRVDKIRHPFERGIYARRGIEY